jgi:hypothetical protein
LRYAADVYHNKMRQQGTIFGAGGFDGDFQWEKEGLLGGYWCVLIKNVFVGWDADLARQTCGDLGGTGMKGANYYPIFIWALACDEEWKRRGWI